MKEKTEAQRGRKLAQDTQLVNGRIQVCLTSEPTI